MVEILNGLTGGAFAKIVEARDDDQALTRFVQRKADVAEIGVRDVLKLGQGAPGPDAHHGAPSIELAVESFDRVGRLLRGKRYVNRGKNTARERQQVR